MRGGRGGGGGFRGGGGGGFRRGGYARPMRYYGGGWGGSFYPWLYPYSQIAVPVQAPSPQDQIDAIDDEINDLLAQRQALANGHFRR